MKWTQTEGCYAGRIQCDKQAGEIYLILMSANMEVPDKLAKIFGHIDAHKEEYIEALAKAVRIKSVSAVPAFREV